MMMDAVFLKLLNMSLTGCVLILAVLPVRALLKRAPRWSICLLWGLVALRLICPFSFESNLSLIRNSEPISRETLSVENVMLSAVTEPVQMEIPKPQLPTVTQKTIQNVVSIPEQSTTNPLAIIGYAWLAGCGLMILYALVSYWKLKHRVRTATRMEGNIRQSEYVTSPFVLGVFRPTIYLPYGLKQSHQSHIIAHERSHISRGDHLIKPLGFMILSVHWFNPCVWVAYILLCRDIEAACDERVIQKMTKEQRQAYSATLLHYSAKHRRIAACPVAFGETGIKGRIKNVMSYKKPTVWLVVMSILLSFVLAGCFLTDPVQEKPREQSQEQLLVSLEDQQKMAVLVDRIADSAWTMTYNLHPDYYRMLNAQAREELLAYGDKALEYLTTQLRATENNAHNLKEQIMVFLCEDLAKVTTIENRYNSDWWLNPGEWLTIYDMHRADSNDKTRLQPGFYQVVDVLYGDITEDIPDHHSQTTYMVTEDAFFGSDANFTYMIVNSVVQGDEQVGNWDQSGIMYQCGSTVYVNNCDHVMWKWEKSGSENDMWAQLKSGQWDAYFVHMGFETLLDQQDYQYQQLDENRCLIQTGTGLYTQVYLITNSQGRLINVYELAKISK